MGHLGFDTVITGAGISFDAPSKLPSGEALGVAAWESLAATIDLPADITARVSARIVDRKLRLEQLLDVMTVGGLGMPLDVLVTAYIAVESDAFNPNHAVLGTIPSVRHFTVNMDTLLEEAARAHSWDIDITHLHGRWNHPEEISTTISQYLAQLDPDLEAEFGKALLGKRVLVAGYSARDRDIQPLLLKYPPNTLTWLVHPTSSSSDPATAREEELAPEAIRVLDELDARSETKVNERRTSILDFLGSAPPTARAIDVSVTRASRGVDDALTEIREVYRGVDAWRRRLAVAAVLGNQGLGDDALPILRRIGAPRTEQSARIAVRKMRARTLRRQGHRGRAMVVLLVPVTTRYRMQVRSVANEFAATLPGTRLHWLADPLDRALVRRASGTTEFLIRTRLVQRQSSRGELRGADAEFRDLSATFTKAQVDLGNWVNLLTWHADVLKARGQVKEAIRMLRDDLEETFYSDASQSAALHWKLLELLLVSGGPDLDVGAGLSQLATAGAGALGANQHCWIQLTRFGASAGRGLDAAEMKAMVSTAGARADTEMFWELQQAEVARAEADFTRAHAHVKAAHRIERDRTRWQGSATGKLAGALISATASAQQAPAGTTARSRAVATLTGVAARLEALGAELPAARARVNAALAGGAAISSSLADAWHDKGWTVEASRVRDINATLSDLWQIVM